MKDDHPKLQIANLTMSRMAWIKHFIDSQQENTSKLREFSETSDIDDLKNKFYQECHLADRGFAFGYGELSVYKINHDGSDEVKMWLETDASLKDFLMPSQDEHHHEHELGPGQCKEHALLVELPATVLHCKSLCCFSFVVFCNRSS